MGMINGLEVIDKGACTTAHPVPLLFVHGAWHGAWCWDEYFLDYFAESGYRALAVSLRGHGGSRAHRRPRSCSQTHYVEDVAAVAEILPTVPVVVGHSMGGVVVQKYLESRRAPAAVLVASLPAAGAARPLGRSMRRHPLRAARMMLTGKSLHSVGTPARARENFFSAGVDESDLARWAGLLCEEVTGRMTLDSMLLDRPHPDRVTTPMLVLGGGGDSWLSPTEVHATAKAYGTDAEIFPGMAHNMMLEPGWQAVAERIDRWLGERGL